VFAEAWAPGAGVSVAGPWPAGAGVVTGGWPGLTVTGTDAAGPLTGGLAPGPVVGGPGIPGATGVTGRVPGCGAAAGSDAGGPCGRSPEMPGAPVAGEAGVRLSPAPWGGGVEERAGGAVTGALEPAGSPGDSGSGVGNSNGVTASTMRSTA
jgi:collagen type IV alpha